MFKVRNKQTGQIFQAYNITKVIHKKEDGWVDNWEEYEIITYNGGNWMTVNAKYFEPVIE